MSTIFDATASLRLTGPPRASRAGPQWNSWPASIVIGLLASGIGLGGAAHAGPDVCRPSLTVTDVQFSGTRPETMERTWSAVVSVDASRCATTSGHFEITFSRQKENAPEADFRETFTWQPPSVKVAVDFWADEAVESYVLNRVAVCPCRR